MTSSELYHGFGLEGCQTVATGFEGRKIILEVESKKRLRCSLYNGTNVVRRGRSHAQDTAKKPPKTLKTNNLHTRKILKVKVKILYIG